MSYLATLKYEDGHYIDADGCHFASWDQALGAVLGFCGCGDPEAALGYVLRVLRAVNMLKTDGWKRLDALAPEARDAAWRAWYADTYQPALDAIFHGDTGAEFFAFYVLTDKKLLEHGGSVPGWLTDLGVQILADLEARADDILPPAAARSDG